MKPIAVFKNGRNHAEHLLKLAELLTNTRDRKMRTDWAKKFKKVMHWKQKEQIDRVDGRGAMLILRESAQITSKNFNEDYTNELLRAAHATMVASLDRYCHELILSRSVRALNHPRAPHNGELRKIALPILDVHKAVKHARKAGSRPMNLVRASLQEVLYKRTFESPSEISQGISIIGVTDLWNSCATRLGCQSNDIRERLGKIVDRRNKIVHESDIIRHKRGGKVKYRNITPKQVANDIIWLGDLVDAIEMAASHR